MIDTPLLTLDDGSGRGLVRLLDLAPTFDPPLHLGEVVNVTGTVATRDVGGWEIVASAEGVLRASRLTVTGSSPSASTRPSALPSPSTMGGVRGGSRASTLDQALATSCGCSWRCWWPWVSPRSWRWRLGSRSPPIGDVPDRHRPLRDPKAAHARTSVLDAP